MKPDPNVVRDVFLAVVDEPTVAAQRQYLDRTCANDPDLRQAVETLLAAHGQAGDFLQQPVGPEHRHGLTEGPGAMIERYRLIQKLGEGGFGAVYAAEQNAPVQRLVALKIIKLGMDTKAVVARFEAERQALALMEHPNIAKVLDAGATETGRPYFVMELVEGIPITDYCNQHKLDIPRRLDLFLQVCHAVQHAHQKGIVHRDLKPSNILVSEQDGRPLPKVIDFGIAKAMDRRLTDKTLVTERHQFLGTPVYCSPEQVDPAAQDVDTRADIYSLGVLLYELLTGKTPFDEGALKQAGWQEVLRILRETDPPKPSTRLTAELAAADVRRPQSPLNQSVNEKATEDGASSRRRLRMKETAAQLRGDLDWIVMKALEKDRNRRYASTSTLALDLERHLKHEPVEAAAPSVAYRTGKFIRRHRLGVAAGCAVGMALLLGTIVSLWQAHQANVARLAVQANRKEAEVLITILVDRLPEQFEYLLLHGLWQEVLAKASNYFAHLPKNENLTPQEEYNRSLALAGLANLHFIKNDAVGWPYYAEAVGTMERLVAKHPNQLEWQRGLARVCANYGRSLSQSDEEKDRIEGHRILRLGLNTITNLLERAPDNFEAQGVSGDLYRLVAAFPTESETTRLEFTRKSQAILLALHERNPQNDHWRFGLYRARLQHGVLLSNRKDYSGAIQEFEAAIRLLSEGIRFAEDYWVWKLVLIEGQIHCARTYRQMPTPENLAAANRHLDAAEVIWEEINRQRRLAPGYSVQPLVLYEAMLTRFETTDPERALHYARRAWEWVFIALEKETKFRNIRRQEATDIYGRYSRLLTQLQQEAKIQGDLETANKYGQELSVISVRHAKLTGKAANPVEPKEVKP